jgi:hypothetical protein
MILDAGKRVWHRMFNASPAAVIRAWCDHGRVMKTSRGGLGRDRRAFWRRGFRGRVSRPEAIRFHQPRCGRPP